MAIIQFESMVEPKLKYKSVPMQKKPYKTIISLCYDRLTAPRWRGPTKIDGSYLNEF